MIKLIPAIGGRYLQDRADLSQIFRESWQFRELLAPYFFGARNELVYLVCLDGKGKLIACRRLGEGVADAATITTRKVMEVALECQFLHRGTGPQPHQRAGPALGGGYPDHQAADGQSGAGGH